MVWRPVSSLHNGKVSIRNFYFNNSGEDDYTHNEFKPFDLINELADNNCNANAISRIASFPISTGPTM